MKTRHGFVSGVTSVLLAIVVLLLPSGVSAQQAQVAVESEVSAQQAQVAAESEVSAQQAQVAAESEVSAQQAQETAESEASADEKEASGKQETSSQQAEEVQAGVQGSPNPLQDDRQYLTGQDLLDDAFPNSVPIPGTNLRFRVGGYAKLDFIQDLDYVGDRYEFELASIPVEGSPEAALDGRTTLQAKETRINFDFRSRQRRGENGPEFPLQVFLELDFFDDRESLALQPRLRHAYGVIGRVLAGQTWNISGDLQALAGTIDFSGGDALYGARVAQLRWQDRFGERVTWAVGVEAPVTSIGNPLGLDGVNREQTPNFAGRVRWTSEEGTHLQVGGDVFRLDWQGGASGPSASAWGFGLNLTGRVLLGRWFREAIVGGATIGKGSAHRVIALSFDGGNDAVITPDGLDVMSHWQAYVGISYYWSDSFNSTITTNWTELDNSEYQPGSAIHRAGSVHANLIWFPYELASTGVEVMWGQRRNKDGAIGQAWRVQYMVKFKFN